MVYKYLFETLFSPRSGISGSYSNSVFNILRNYPTVFHDSCTVLHFQHKDTLVVFIFKAGWSQGISGVIVVSLRGLGILELMDYSPRLDLMRFFLHSDLTAQPGQAGDHLFSHKLFSYCSGLCFSSSSAALQQGFCHCFPEGAGIETTIPARFSDFLVLDPGSIYCCSGDFHFQDLQVEEKYVADLPHGRYGLASQSSHL